MGNFLVILVIISKIFSPNLFASPKLLANIKNVQPLINEKPLFNLSSFSSYKTINIPEDVLQEITAQNLLIKEIGGTRFFEKNANEVKPIASLTKLMTSLIAYEIYSENEKFQISKNAVMQIGEAGFFVQNEVFTRNELIKAGLIVSSNDAMYALGEKIGIENFINKMNSKAKELNMLNTSFVDVTGISEGNISTLEDLYILTEYLMRNAPELISWSKIQEFTLNGKTQRRLVNLNYLLPIYSQYIYGSKTGYTQEAGECLILLLKFKNSPFIFLGLLGSENRFSDAEKLINVLKEIYE